MAINAVRNFLVCYDIADPDRLTKVHRTVRRWGMPLQYSVFLVPAAPSAIGDLLKELRQSHRPPRGRHPHLPAAQPTRHEPAGPTGPPEGIALTDASKVGHVLELLAGGGRPQ